VVLVLAPQINGHGATSHFYRERYPDTHGEAAVEAARFGQVEGLALSLVAGLGGRAAVEIVQGASCTEVRDPKFPDLVVKGACGNFVALQVTLHCNGDRVIRLPVNSGGGYHLNTCDGQLRVCVVALEVLAITRGTNGGWHLVEGSLVAQTNTAGEIIGFVVLVLAPQINGHGATSHFYRERYPDTHGEAAVEAARFGQVEGLALSLVAGLGGRAAVEIVQGASCTEVRDPKFPDLVVKGACGNFVALQVTLHCNGDHVVRLPVNSGGGYHLNICDGQLGVCVIALEVLTITCGANASWHCVQGSSVTHTNAAGEIIGFVVLVLAPNVDRHGAARHLLRKLDRSVHNEIAHKTVRICQVQCLAMGLVAGLRRRSTVEIVHGASCTEVFHSEFPDLVVQGTSLDVEVMDLARHFYVNGVTCLPVNFGVRLHVHIGDDKLVISVIACKVFAIT